MATSASTLTQEEREDGAGRRTAPHLYVALSCERLFAPPSRHDLDGVDEVVLGRGENAKRLPSNRFLRLTSSVNGASK